MEGAGDFFVKEDVEHWRGDMGVETTEKLLMRVKARLKKSENQITNEAINILKEEMLLLIKSSQHSNSTFALSDRPLIILVIGVNGVGKTTSIAKMAKTFLALDKQPMLVQGKPSNDNV